jgi:replicative DNA helicase
LGRIHRWIDEAKPDLLVLGPLYRMTKGSLNNDDEVGPVLEALDSLRERDVAMLIEVHAGHARSTSGERELRPRGSSALLGWPEFGMGLRKGKGDQGKRPHYELVRWRGDRDRREWPARLVRGFVWPWEPSAVV